MANATLTTTAQKIITSIVVIWTSAKRIRMCANVDLPEYGLVKDQVFYLCYSDTESKEQGQPIYHIVPWNYERIRWECPCKATVKNCCHVKDIVKNIQENKTRRQTAARAEQQTAKAASAPAPKQEEQRITSIEASLPAWMMRGRATNGRFSGKIPA